MGQGHFYYRATQRRTDKEIGRLTLPEIADLLGISRQAVWQAVRDGKVKARWRRANNPHGGYWNITERALIEWRPEIQQDKEPRE